MSNVLHRIGFKIHTWLNIWPSTFTWDSIQTLDTQEPIYNSAGNGTTINR